jgi:hypothetical protein
MLKFPSIDQFRHAVATVKRAAEYHGKPLPVIEYEGRIKLHGTNAGIHVNIDTGKVTAQSRERSLTVNSDNYGFAAFVARNEAAILAHVKPWFEGFIGAEEADEVRGVTIYGEWIGPGIQKNVGIAQLPERQFVVFSIAYDDTIKQNDDGSTDAIFYNIPEAAGTLFDIPGFKMITDVPVIKLSIDFSRPDEVVETLQKLTQEVEDNCPYAKLYDIDGIGEGLVWSPSVMSLFILDDLMPEEKFHRIWFKTKGEKHGNKGTNNTVKVAVTAEKIEDFTALCSQLLPEWRLEQGFNALPTDSSAQPARTQTGAFLKWVTTDVYKEELDTILASEFEWKVVAQELSKRARIWFLEKAS